MKRKRMQLLGHLGKKVKPAGSKKVTPPAAPAKGKKVTSPEPPVQDKKVSPPAAPAAEKPNTDDKQ